jgi:hypothetical protein
LWLSLHLIPLAFDLSSGDTVVADFVDVVVVVVGCDCVAVDAAFDGTYLIGDQTILHHWRLNSFHSISFDLWYYHLND